MGVEPMSRPFTGRVLSSRRNSLLHQSSAKLVVCSLPVKVIAVSPILFWLEREDSNLRMAVPKTAALPLGDAPIILIVYLSMYAHTIHTQLGILCQHY